MGICLGFMVTKMLLNTLSKFMNISLFTSYGVKSGWMSCMMMILMVPKVILCYELILPRLLIALDLF